MAIIIKKTKKPKIICGFIVPDAIFGLYEAVPNRQRAEEIIKETFGIHPNRLIRLEQPYSNDRPVSIIVIYDLFIEGADRYRYIGEELLKFNFPIFEYDRITMPNIEEILLSIKGEVK